MSSDLSLHYNMDLLKQAPDYMASVNTELRNASQSMRDYYTALAGTGYLSRTNNYTTSYSNILSNITGTTNTLGSMKSDCESIITEINNFNPDLTADAAAIASAAAELDLANNSEEIAEATAALAAEPSKDNSAWDNIVGFFKDLGKEVLNFLGDVCATIADVVISLFQGIVKLLEGVVDALALLVNVIGQGVICVANLLGADWDIESWKNNCMAFVSKDWTGSAFNAFYENTWLGQQIANNSWIYGTAVREVLVGAGTWVGIIAVGAVITYFSGGTLLAPYCALVGGLYGLGSGTETAWAAGAGYWGGAGIGALKGGVYAVSAYAMGKSCQGLYDSVVANIGKSSSTALTTTGATVAGGGNPTAVGQVDVNTYISDAAARGNTKLTGISQWFADHGATSAVGYSDGTVSFLTADGSILGTISSNGFQYISPAMNALTTGLATTGGSGVAGLLSGPAVEAVGTAAVKAIGGSALKTAVGIGGGLLLRGAIEAATSTPVVTGVYNEQKDVKPADGENGKGGKGTQGTNTGETGENSESDENTDDKTTDGVTSGGETPGDETPVAEIPVDDTTTSGGGGGGTTTINPVQEVPVDEVPISTDGGGNTPSTPTYEPEPVEPVDEIPVDSGETGDTGKTDEPVEEIPKDEPVEEIPKEEPTEEIPKLSPETEDEWPEIIVTNVGPKEVVLPGSNNNGYNASQLSNRQATVPEFSTPDETVPEQPVDPTYNWESASPTIEAPDMTGMSAEETVNQVASKQIEVQAIETTGSATLADVTEIENLNASSYNTPGFDTSMLGMGTAILGAGGATTYGAVKSKEEDKEKKEVVTEFAQRVNEETKKDEFNQ